MMDSKNYSNPQDYWDRRAKKFGVSAPGLGGTTVNDVQVLETIDASVGHFKTLLDFGCGPGRLYSTLVKHCDRYIGVDFSYQMLKLFRENHVMRTGDFTAQGNLVRSLGQRGSIPLIKGSIDALVCNMVIQHIVDLEQFLQAIRNITSLLKVGGTLYLHEAMLTPEEYPQCPHIALRPITHYQALFRPNFELQVGVSNVKDHTMLFGSKLC
jgi:SAM-dependent methyltransferase